MSVQIIKVTPLAIFNCISVAMWSLAIYLNRNGRHHASMTVGLIEVIIHQALCVIIIGWGAGFQYYVLLLPIGVCLMSQGRNILKFVLILICLISFSLLDFKFRGAEPIYSLNSILLNVFNYSNIIIFVILASFASFFSTKKYMRLKRL